MYLLGKSLVWNGEEIQGIASDIAWVYERMQRGEEKRPFVRPGWVVYLDRKRIATFYGTKNWEEVHFPEIKWLVSEHLGKYR